MTDGLHEIIALAVLVLIAIALFVMTRRRERPAELTPAEEPIIWADMPAEPQPRPQPAAAINHDIGPVLGSPEDSEQLMVREQLKTSVTQLVEKQPEEIAVLLRSWLADRR